MKIVALALTSFFLFSGCATKDYAVYVDAQKSLSKDVTVTEAARLNALIELAKSADPAVRASAVLQIQQLQQGSKPVIIEPPKKNWLGF